MCLIVFAWQAHHATPLLLAANRDEFHARPTQAAAFWEHEPEVLAGQDLVAGGTWLGVTRRGRFAAITNVRQAQADKPRSRGELTLDFLSGNATPRDYLNTIAKRSHDYQGFNLLVGDGKSLWYLHAGADGPAQPLELTPGIYGLSNASIDVPWPKVRRARDQLRAQLQAARDAAPGHDALRQCLSDRSLAAATDVVVPGMDTTIAQQLSAQFIVTPEYGTRCCTSLRFHAQGGWDFQELRFDAQGQETGRDQFSSSTTGH
ncbi:MAG: NRDE family protein [Congregibacter sp.]